MVEQRNGMVLNDVKIAMIVANGFEQSEMTEPRKALEHAGALVHVVSPEKNKVKGWKHAEWGDQFLVDVALDVAHPDHYDALVLPGGVMNPDRLRIIPRVIEFIKTIHAAGKPIAAICHGPWPLINAGIVAGRMMTSWLSLQADLTNAGARWVDRSVVCDGNLITSRKPEDIPAFNVAMIELLRKS